MTQHGRLLATMLSRRGTPTTAPHRVTLKVEGVLGEILKSLALLASQLLLPHLKRGVIEKELGLSSAIVSLQQVQML